MNLLNVISEQFCSSSTCLLVQDCEHQDVRKPGHCLHQEERPLHVSNPDPHQVVGEPAVAGVRSSRLSPGQMC